MDAHTQKVIKDLVELMPLEDLQYLIQTAIEDKKIFVLNVAYQERLMAESCSIIWNSIQINTYVQKGK